MKDPFEAQTAAAVPAITEDACPVLDNSPVQTMPSKIFWIDEKLFFGILIGIVLIEFIRSIARES